MATKPYMLIDGIPVEINGEKNLLELIRKTGIKMPTFCYHTELSIYGACRLCMVENEKGGLEAACSTPPHAGMSIKTNTERLHKHRKMILELLLANHCRDCTTCQNNGKCKLQDIALRFGVDHVRFENTFAEHRYDDSSVSVLRDASKCILCGDCVRMCNEIQNVGAIDFAHRGSKMTISTAFNRKLADSPCVGCGQCIAACPTGALVIKSATSKVWKELDDPKTFVTVQIAPAVRVAVGKELGLDREENVFGLIVAALRRMGFDEVYDTAVSADLTVIEEAAELAARIAAGKETMPLFSSCCPGWIRFCETRYPEMLRNVSSCKSPMQMFASVLREKEKQNGVPGGKRHVHVAIMPCTAKKYEAAREEFRHDGRQDVDYVVSTSGLIRMIREGGIVLGELLPEGADVPFGVRSGAGVIFGATGGVTEAVLRHLCPDKSASALRSIAFTGVRGLDGVKETSIMLGEREVKIAIVSGLGNASHLIDRIEAGEVQYDFVEVMACPGGCVSGGGQPFQHAEERARRADQLYSLDRMSSLHRAEENPALPIIYDQILKGRAHELLHVHYNAPQNETTKD